MILVLGADLRVAAGLACWVWATASAADDFGSALEQSHADYASITLEGAVVGFAGTPLDVFTLTVYRRGRAPGVHSFKRAGGRLKVDLVGREWV